jgi:hypothetical protein
MGPRGGLMTKLSLISPPFIGKATRHELVQSVHACFHGEKKFIVSFFRFRSCPRG